MKYVSFLLSVVWSSLSAQVITDDFSDGNFTHHPTWTGDSLKFVVNPSSELQLFDTASGTSCLSTASPGSSLQNKEWRCWIRENFSPSANNYGRFYLASDRAVLNDSVNGYFLQFGEAGSNDAVELFRQRGASIVSVCRGTNGEIATSFSIGVKVTRDSLGDWNLFIDANGGTNYSWEAAGTDTIIQTTAFFGVLAMYTLTDDTKFYWTDFYAGPVYVNHVLPTISTVQLVSKRKLDVQFNEAVDSVNGSLPANYSVTPGIGHPLTALLDTNSKTLVHLVFSAPFQPNSTYRLLVSQLQNNSGDIMVPDSLTFWLYEPAEFDVVINEIMFNPKPPVGLPPYEYIELYNRTNLPVSLANWTIRVGNKEASIGPVIILPDSFVVVCSASSANAFNPSLPVFGVTGFPPLNNTAAEVTLKTDSGRVMSCISYSDTWLNDSQKKKGGWSLEQIDQKNPCGGENNWKASQDPLGGSPGGRNSVAALNPDHAGPGIRKVTVISKDTLCVFFNEPLDSATLNNAVLFTAQPAVQILSLHPVGNEYSSVIVCLGYPLVPGVIYTLTVAPGIRDCVGNTMSIVSGVRFALPQEAGPLDIVFNELLSDPSSGGVKYVECYNRSNRVIDLLTLSLAEADSITGSIIDSKRISSEGYLFFPGEYILLSTNSGVVKTQYVTQNPNAFVEMTAFPKMDIGGGTLALVTSSGLVLDEVVYSAGWQFPLLKNTRGVSLERIDFDKPTQDPENWHSAAETSGFGTPGYRNSEFMQPGNGQEVTLAYTLFSPDEDGYHDLLFIEYKFDRPGYLATIQIYDTRGRLIRSLCRNVLAGEEGSFVWDGVGDNLEKAPIGVYIVYFQAFALDGERREYKKVCVLAGKL
jgi:hypothetical protein